MVLRKFVRFFSFLSVDFLLMLKFDIYFIWYFDVKVICNGEVVMIMGVIQFEIYVDVWSGNYFFFIGIQKIFDIEGCVDCFMKKYGMGIKKKGVDFVKVEFKV